MEVLVLLTDRSQYRDDVTQSRSVHMLVDVEQKWPEVQVAIAALKIQSHQVDL